MAMTRNKGTKCAASASKQKARNNSYLVLQDTEEVYEDGSSEPRALPEQETPVAKENHNVDVHSNESYSSVESAVKFFIDSLKSDNHSDLLQNVIQPLLDPLIERIKKLEDENKAKQLRISELETNLDRIEQDLRQKSLLIHGVDEDNGDTNGTVVKMVKQKLNIDIGKDDIDQAYRIGKDENSGVRPILVNFSKFETRQQLLRSKSQLRNADGRPIYINENLTKVRRKLLYEARKLMKKKLVYKVWTYHGNVYVKETSYGAPIMISKASDLERFDMKTESPITENVKKIVPMHDPVIVAECADKEANHDEQMKKCKNEMATLDTSVSDNDSVKTDDETEMSDDDAERDDDKSTVSNDNSVVTMSHTDNTKTDTTQSMLQEILDKMLTMDKFKEPL